MIQRFLILTSCLSGLAFGQVNANSVTVTATRTANLQPDQVVFAVNVISGLDVTRDAVVAALQGSGLTVANFTNVNTIQQYVPPSSTPQNSLQWTFTLPVAITNMKSTIGLLTAVQTSIAKSNPGLSLTFGVQGTQVSPQLQQSQPCVVADLLTDARAQAQRLAGAAGMTVGAVLAISGMTATANGGTANPFAQPSYAPGCSLVVKFALGAF